MCVQQSSAADQQKVQPTVALQRARKTRKHTSGAGTQCNCSMLAECQRAGLSMTPVRSAAAKCVQRGQRAVSNSCQFWRITKWMLRSRQKTLLVPMRWDVHDVARSAQRAVARQNPEELRQRALSASSTIHSFRQDQHDAHCFASRCSLCGAGSRHSFRNTGALIVTRELSKP